MVSEVCVDLEVALVLLLSFLLGQLLVTKLGEASAVGAPGLMYSALCLRFFPKWLYPSSWNRGADELRLEASNAGRGMRGVRGLCGPGGSKIPYPGVKAFLDNAIMPLSERAKQGVRPSLDNQKASPEVTVGVRPARLATTNITNWKLEQQEDPVLNQVFKHRKASRETFKEALLKVTDRKAVSAYVKSKDQLVMRNGLLYQQSKQGQTQETVLQLVVPQIHRNVALDGCHW